ncbi:LOR/SDH bifunctional enzyme conserved domain protein [Methanocorpusculum labreanum Z]|uniref:Ornithine cyclodeaminase n=1 Tax=Methanocorpusculum labreanum (strain ATCC 43576 / DSM 4855 / Z) TaxID=410358 RepID=A2SRA2_METLZ|nr:TIGR00300 family protein [Methanocorpusculum labreanum]ABN06858.1 LOR/SDH bifunctional enzyme conserved domain protein [Methanocorpusculum labreanum Z]
MKFSREIELRGHIVDSGILAKVMDTVVEYNGDFETEEFTLGRQKTDPSYARMQISAETPEQLSALISELRRLGVLVSGEAEVELVSVVKAKVAPEGFYSTTNHPTYVHYLDTWIPVDTMKMDALISVDTKNMTAKCVVQGKLQPGDTVVVGEEGVKVDFPERPREIGVFEFMGGNVSSERPSRTIISRIAKELLAVKASGKKVALVGGPAIVHTGASDSVAAMIREGYLDVIFAGNALATHDLESSIFGTSLGMNLATGELVSGGHRHHLYTINKIMNAGSIRAAVESGLVTRGIMYECIKNNVPYVLAGSIRDDGPLPDVIQNVMESQDAMRRHIPELGMVLMVATLLHSVAVGNLLPSHVKTICVDINPASVTKLMDRGTSQAIGLISDAGTFMPLLLEELRNQSKH